MRALLLLCLALPAAAQAPAVDLRGVTDPVAGGPTRVFVLGTPHLANLDDRYETAHLGPLLDRLAAFAPDVITTEDVPGQTCSLLRRYPSEYPGVADRYCIAVEPAQTPTGLTGPEAEAEVRATLAAWPEHPTPAQRRRLAAAFWAAGDAYSALVQWLRLPAAERRPGDGIDENLAGGFEWLETQSNESSQIAVRLAVRLGHERIYPSDDHSADALIAPRGGAFWEEMRRVWAQDVGEWDERRDQAEASLGSAEGLLAYYRFLNGPEAQEATLDNDFRLALRHGDPDGHGRAYVAWWQVRNLRQVAHIVAAAASAPGGRVLSVVGASHKPYFEAYLDVMHDVELVETAEVLGE